MRYRILNMLYDHELISGEKISATLGISRAAVGKHIQALRAQGYEIAAAPHQGYRLLAVPDLLNPAEIFRRLPADSAWRIESFAELDSTSAYLRRLVENKPDTPQFQVAIAERQTAGTGRLGRPWYSPPGSGLWMSVLLRPRLAPQLAQLVTLTAAVAVAEALDRLGFSSGIKWPNDILAPDKTKLCGIKCEMRAEMDGVSWIIAGIGVNINNEKFPHELSGIASSLRMLNKGEPLSRALVAAAILERMAADYALLREGRFAAIRDVWHKYAVGLGGPVTVNGSRGEERGVALGLDEEGYLLLRQGSAIKRVLAGDLDIPR